MEFGFGPNPPINCLTSSVLGDLAPSKCSTACDLQTPSYSPSPVIRLSLLEVPSCCIFQKHHFVVVAANLIAAMKSARVA